MGNTDKNSGGLSYPTARYCPTQSACYYGPKGSTTPCSTTAGSIASTFSAPTLLQPKEGLTVAVGFPKGVVTPYTTPSPNTSTFATGWWWFFIFVPPLITLTLSLLYWWKRGRDPKGRGVIIAQYDVPDELTPFEVAGIIKQKVSAKNIAAEIIYLATKGYLKIREVDERPRGFMSTKDYELELLNDYATLPNDFDRMLFEKLFKKRPQFTLASLKQLLRGKQLETAGVGDEGKTVRVSDFKNVPYADMRKPIGLVLAALIQKGYYKNLGRIKNNINRFALFFGIAFFFLTVMGFLLTS